MSEHIFALLVHDHPETFESLRRTLKDLAVETYSVASCKEARDLITKCKPSIIFADSSLADGSWVSVLNMAEAADVPLSLIVVGGTPNTRHYLSVMEHGAYDLVAPPFEHEALSFVVQSAALNAHRRRQAMAPSAAAH
jgi:DNA-binding NtrC family response regulator